MYATNLTDQLFSAALPLKPLVAWCGSACSVTVAVPPAAALAGLDIGSVGVTLSLPDGSNVAVQAVHVANTPLWTATFPASNFATSGTVAQGLMVTLAGEDENGVVRTWIVAKGDLEVRPGDASPSPGGSWVAVKLRDGAPNDPVEGDAYVSDGELHIFAGGEWVVIGGGHDAAKLDGAAAYPAWEDKAYAARSVVSYNGGLWRALGVISQGDPDPSVSSNWEEVSINDLKQDTLTQSQLAAVNSGATAAKVATWDGYSAQIAAKANAADMATALDGKRGVTDLLVRGNPAGEGTWFSVDGDAYEYNGGVWTREEGSPFDGIGFNASEGTYVLIGGEGDVAFTLDADYSASVTYLGTTYIIVGYVDTIAKVSEITAAVSGKADKAVPSTAGNLAALNAQGNLEDSGVKPSDFAAKADLPYAMVTPGEWEFSDGGNYTIQGPLEDGFWAYYSPQLGWSNNFMTEADALAALSLEFVNEGDRTVIATRASLPGHLLDRAVNSVSVTSDTTLTLPALVNAGKARDFLVRLAVSGSTVPTITFAAPTGETITYETDGDEFPVPDEAGTWLYSFTESCVAHKFAVSLKKVNEVAQGGA